ncbi:hypothetical protein HMPREF9318_00906 [Streptococcus urinalis FB127-CNA-2]|nr:hypothetical protein HMPREF9318_00906 [Streptococcus urinalis FB127-CNA-2]VEF30961.1 NUDIX hydrolase [Streptococcus urinalis]
MKVMKKLQLEKQWKSYLSQNQIFLLGEIDYIVFSDRTIHCFVGKLDITNTCQLSVNDEVDKFFTVSLKYFIENKPKYYDLKMDIVPNQDFPFEKINDGVNYKFTHHNRAIPFYEGLDETIWWLTAQFIDCFTKIIKK